MGRTTGITAAEAPQVIEAVREDLRSGRTLDREAQGVWIEASKALMARIAALEATLDRVKNNARIAAKTHAGIRETNRLLEAENERLKRMLALVAMAPGCTESEDCDPYPHCQICRASGNEFNPEEAHYDNCPLGRAIEAPTIGRDSTKPIPDGLAEPAEVAHG